ncbi:glycosyltransferase [Sphingomonas sp. PL-96]|uniref:glycosyltransferase n=1 Tax=Sphingomonas sp. PL-96 TaxID=2887201 RepID=UPI001E2B7BAE|nr:glycosyltransferase [Sphingomonas sp. PL-96]MCC2976609.1 glycosyltransferase [Sphingomonas sp. PL-96]
MKILHVAETAKGGVGTYLAELLPLQAQSFGARNVRMLVPAAHAGHVTGVDKQMVRCWRRSGRSPLNLLRLALAIRTEVARFNPTLVHAHSSFAGAVLRMMYPSERPFRLVYCPHGWGFDRPSSHAKNRMLAMVERALASKCDEIIVISEHERSEGLRIGIPHASMSLVLNGISDGPPSLPSHWEDERLKVLFVGRLDRQKGFDTLLDAVAPLADRICVRALGEAVADPRKSRTGGEGIQLLGWRSLAEIAGEIAAADVVVVPSRWEGFGLVALEAMRGSCAVVASDVGGLREIVVDGVTGRLVPPDAPGRLMEVLSHGDRAYWKRLGKEGRRRFVSFFTAERMNADLVQVYLHLESGIADVPLGPRPLLVREVPRSRRRA